MESVCHADDAVWSAHTTIPTRVPDKKVHNYRFDRWIALKLFSRVFGGCFAWSSMESVCPADDAVQSAHTTDPTRVPDQKVHNYRFDRWIALKCFSRVFGGIFTWSSEKSVLHADDVWWGHTANTTTVPAQKVHNYRSDRWIALNVLH